MKSVTVLLDWITEPLAASSAGRLVTGAWAGHFLAVDLLDCSIGSRSVRHDYTGIQVKMQKNAREAEKA